MSDTTPAVQPALRVPEPGEPAQLTFTIHGVEERDGNEASVSLISVEKFQAGIFSVPVASLRLRMTPEQSDAWRRALREKSVTVTLKMETSP